MEAIAEKMTQKGWSNNTLNRTDKSGRTRTGMLQKACKLKEADLELHPLPSLRGNLARAPCS